MTYIKHEKIIELHMNHYKEELLYSVYYKSILYLHIYIYQIMKYLTAAYTRVNFIDYD